MRSSPVKCFRPHQLTSSILPAVHTLSMLTTFLPQAKSYPDNSVPWPQSKSMFFFQLLGCTPLGPFSTSYPPPPPSTPFTTFFQPFLNHSGGWTLEHVHSAPRYTTRLTASQMVISPTCDLNCDAFLSGCLELQNIPGVLASWSLAGRASLLA